MSEECRFEDVIVDMRSDIKDIKKTVESFEVGLRGTEDGSKRGVFARVDILEAFKTTVIKVVLGILSAGGITALSILIYKIAGVSP